MRNSKDLLPIELKPLRIYLLQSLEQTLNLIALLVESEEEEGTSHLVVVTLFVSLGLCFGLGSRRAPQLGAGGIGVARGGAGAKVAVNLDYLARLTAN